MIGQYLSDGYITSREIINVIERISYDSESPLAYLLKSLENLKEERRLEAKILAHSINATIRMHTFGNLKMYKIDSAVIMILR